MRLGIIGVAVFIAAYVASIVLYVDDGMGRPRQVAESPPSSDGTTVVVDVEDIQSDNSLLIANYTISRAPQLLDPVTHGLKDDLSLLVTSAISASKHTWSKGTMPDGFSVSSALNGVAAGWPFDRYQSGPITVHLLSGAAQQPVIPMVVMADRLRGWKIDVAHDKNDLFAPYRLDLYRSSSTVAFGVVILAVLITLAGVALIVAVQTARHRRKFQAPMTTWYAAMLFAVMPLREALPDAPRSEAGSTSRSCSGSSSCW